MADWHCILNSEIDGKALYYESPIISDYAEHLHLGGLYNSLYPYDWLKITGSRSFRCEIKGLARESRVSIFLHSPNAPAKVIKQVGSALTDETIEISLSDFNPEPGQRLTCQIETLQHLLTSHPSAGLPTRTMIIRSSSVSLSAPTTTRLG